MGVDQILGAAMEALGTTRARDPQLYDYLLETLGELADTNVSESAYVSLLTEYGAAARRGELLSPPGTTGQTYSPGQSFDDIAKQFGTGGEIGGSDFGGRIYGAPGDEVISVINDSGKTIAKYQLAPNGKYVQTGGGLSGSGTGSGSGARDALAQAGFERDMFESDRDFNRGVLESDRGFGEDKRQFDLGFGENQRQFDLGYGQRERGQLGDLALGLGNLNLNQQKFVADVLRNPADFLARAFLQRGGKSPYPEVTQADIINKLREGFANTQGLIQGQLGGAPGLKLPAANKLPVSPLTPGLGGPIKATAFPQGPDLRFGPDSFQSSVEGESGGFDNPITDDNPFTNIFVDTPEVYSQDDPNLAGYGIYEQMNAAQQAAGGGAIEAPRYNRGTRPRMYMGGSETAVDDEMFIVGDDPGNPHAKPELLINHGDTDGDGRGEFDIMSNPQLMEMIGDGEIEISDSDDGKGGRSRKMKFQTKGYAQGTDPLRKSKRRRGPGDTTEYPVFENENRQHFRPEAKLDASQVTDLRNRDRTLGEKARAFVGNLTSLAERNSPAKGRRPTTRLKKYAGGTLDGLSPESMSMLSLFDTVDTSRVTQDQLLNNARMSTPPGPANVAQGMRAPDLDVTAGSSFKLFSPQQYTDLTPDEQAALGTRLASENKSLGDFLFQSQRVFAGRPRQRPRGRLNVMS